MSTKLTRRQFLTVTATAATGAAIAACAPAAAPAPPAAAPAAATSAPAAPAATSVPVQVGKNPGTLIAATARQYDDLSPLGVYGVVNVDIYKRVFDSLVQFDPKLQIQPDLAQGWERSDDGKTWTFHLRDGIKWHDGAPFTSKDVAFTLNRVANPAVLAYHGFVTKPIAGAQEVADGKAEELSGVTTPDDKTVVIQLTNPSASFLAGMTKVWMVPQHLLGDIKPADLPKAPMWSTQLVGTGMYKMTNYIPKQVIELEANPDWVLGAPKIKNWIWSIIPDRSTQLLGLEKGEIDYINFGGNKDEVARIKNTPILYYIEANEPRTDVFGLNNSRVDKTLRQAMAYATDPEAILEAMGGPTVARIQDYFFMNEWIADGSVKWSDVYKYDPAKAKELLAAANYDPSREIVFITKGDKTPPPDAILLQEMLQDVGMTVNVKLVDTVSPYLYESLDYDIANTGNVYDDPFIQAAVFSCGAAGSGGNSLTQYCNPEVDKLIAADALAKDDAERAALYQKMQEHMVNDAASIPKPYSPGRAVFNKRVKVPGPWAWYVWDNSWQWELES